MKISKRGRRIKERYNIIRGVIAEDMEFESQMLAIQTLIPIGLEKVREELMERDLNVSAVNSLGEGETLTLHRQGMFTKLGTSFKTIGRAMKNF